MEYASEKCWKDDRYDRIQAYLRKVTVLMILTLSCDGHVVVYQEGILHFNSTLNYYPPFEVVLKKTTEIIRRCRLTLLHTIGILQSDDMLITYILWSGGKIFLLAHEAPPIPKSLYKPHCLKN